MKEMALITGASSGIGLELAKYLASLKYPLLLISNESQKLLKLKEEISNNFQVFTDVMCIDLSKKEAPYTIFNFCKSKNYHIDILVNNAGFFFFGEAVEVNTEKSYNMISLHIQTVATLCTIFGKEMKQRKKGFILNNSSISAYKDFPGIAYYGASKAFIKSFTRSLRTEMKYYNVKVSCLCPGATATNLYDQTNVNVKLGKKLGIMMPASIVAKKGVKGMFKDKSIIIPGLLTKIMVFLALITPHALIYLIRKHSNFLK